MPAERNDPTRMSPIQFLGWVGGMFALCVVADRLVFYPQRNWTDELVQAALMVSCGALGMAVAVRLVQPFSNKSVCQVVRWINPTCRWLPENEKPS